MSDAVASTSWQHHRTHVPDHDPTTNHASPNTPPDASPDTKSSDAPPDTPPVPPPDAPPGKPRRRWRRRFILALVLVMVALGAVSFMTRSARLVNIIETVLEDALGCEARVGRAHLAWNGELTVDGIELSVPGVTGDAAKLLHSDRVVLRLRFLPMLIGKARAASVTLTQPTLYLTEDLDDGRFNYEKLIARPDQPDDDGGGLPSVLPEFNLNGGQVRFGQITRGTYQPAEGFTFDGTLNVDDERPGGYTFNFNQHTTEDSQAPSRPGPTIHGIINLREPMLQVQIDRFKFAGPHRYLLPEEMRLWWDRLSPRGDLPKMIFNAGLDDDQHVTLSAEMRLDGIGLSLPIQEGDPLRLNDVTGRVILTDSVAELKTLTGEIEGIRFSADGQVQGFQAESPLSITLSTEPFDLPEEGGLWNKLPAQVSRYQERFSPHGRYQTQVTIDRPATGAPLWFSGSLDLLDTRFKYDRFPYQAKQLTGKITFDNQRVELHDLDALGPSGGQAVVSGTILPPGGDGAVDITIRGSGFAVDDYLLDAMKPKHRKVMDMFFNDEGYQYLIEQGVVRAVDDQADGAGGSGPDADGVPVFVPGGTASMIVKIQRQAGPDQPYRVTTDLDVAGLRSVFRFWHIPFYADRGRVVITPEEVQVRDVHMRAVGGGGGVVNGTLILPGNEQALIPALKLDDLVLPINHTLVSSIPRPKDQWVRSLQLQGTLVGTGKVYADADGEVAFTVDTTLQDGSARPNGGGYTLSQVQGQLTVERTRIRFEDLTCLHDEGTITLNGQTDFGEAGLVADLTFLGDNLRIEPGLIDLLPTGHEGRPILAELFSEYAPDGVVDAQLHYFGGAESPDRFTLTMEPESIDFDLHGQRIELDDLTGSAELTPSRAVLHGMAGRFAAGTFKADGEVRLGDDPGVNLAFDVHAGQIDAAARAVLPEAVLGIIDKLSFQGPYSIQDAHLLTWPSVEEGPSMIFEGKVHLRDAQAQIGVPVSELDATLDMHITAFAQRRWPHTDIRIQADELRVADRLVRNLSLTAETGQQPWLIELADVKGSIYGGTLVGWGQLRMGKEAAFGFDMTLQEVELEPFLNPLETVDSSDIQDPDDPELSTRNMASGLLSAGLTIRIPTDDPTQRQGRGVVTVRDAKLYDRPITLALLQAASLALPNESSFDRAAARYIIYGDTVQFDDIRFEAPAFVIAGTGTMDYPTTNLNLRMVTHNPGAPDLGPISVLVQSFKDELLGIEVGGTLAEPKARVVSLEGVFRSWGRIFGETRAPLTGDRVNELRPGTN